MRFSARFSYVQLAVKSGIQLSVLCHCCARIGAICTGAHLYGAFLGAARCFSGEKGSVQPVQQYSLWKKP